MPQAQPELKKVCLRPLTTIFPSRKVLDLPIFKYMEKRLFVQLNGNRMVIGILRGYDVRCPRLHPSPT